MNFETETEHESPTELEAEGELESPFNEMEELELAAELLETGNEAELDNFIGRLLRRAAGPSGRLTFRGRLGALLARALRHCIKHGALPPLGGYKKEEPAAPPPDDQKSSPSAEPAPAAGAAEVFGMELEGLSHEDQEFEAARQFVRLAGSAGATAANIAARTPAGQVARRALSFAARRLAPGLLHRSAGPGPCPCHSIREGRWERRGDEIILHGF
ncbi:MAG TPA: hypothetical protein PLX89_12660 [Verrucomicrobiota bacterium]|nr:hypothetical protein [Verrucomicrobiales bacterium]HRI13843.1 hypothetical protein [Verrucomicrobiota bacterium]